MYWSFHAYCAWVLQCGQIVREEVRPFVTKQVTFGSHIMRPPAYARKVWQLIILTQFSRLAFAGRLWYDTLGIVDWLVILSKWPNIVFCYSASFHPTGLSLLWVSMSMYEQLRACNRQTWANVSKMMSNYEQERVALVWANMSRNEQKCNCLLLMIFEQQLKGDEQLWANCQLIQKGINASQPEGVIH